MSFFKHTETGKRVAIFHIGSSSVLITYIELRVRNTVVVPHILYTALEEIPIREEVNFGIFLDSMIVTLESALTEITKAKLGAPDGLVCFLGSPWYAAQSRNIHYEKHTNFTVTEKFIADLISKESLAFQKEELATYQEAGNTAEVIEKEITHIALNGYPLEKINSQKGQKLTISLIISISPSIVLKRIRQSIEKSYHSRGITFHSFMYVGTLITRDLFISTQNFLFVDIGGEITDIALVKNNVVVNTISFPYGKNVLIRKCAKGMGKSISDVVSLLALYQQNTLEPTSRLKLEKLLETVKHEWATSFELALSKLTMTFLLPDTIALTITPDMLTFFSDAIHSERFTQFTITEKPFTIVPITNQSLAPFLTGTTEAMPQLNPFTSLETLAVAKKYT